MRNFAGLTPFLHKIMRETVFRFLIALILISSFSFVGFAQTDDTEETPILIPNEAMEQVVRRVLVWSFKPRNKPTLIYLGEQRIKQSWLPTIKNIEFRLLSAEEIERKNLEVYFFTEPELSGKTYSIGFAFGTPNCNYLGDYWHFRISNQKVRLWQNGGVGGGCSNGF